MILNFYNWNINYGGFKHNWQSILLPAHLEWEMNLTDYTLYGMLYHTTLTKDENKYTRDYLKYYYDFSIKRSKNNKIKLYDFIKNKYSLEAYIVFMADEIAQRHHDIEDGLEYGLITPEKLLEELKEERINKIKTYYEDNNFMPKELLDKYYNELMKTIQTLKGRKSLFTKIYGKVIVNILTTDLIFNIANNLKKYQTCKKINDFDEADLSKIVCQSDILIDDDKKFKELLKTTIHNSQQVQKMNTSGSTIIENLFKLYVNNPLLLPDSVFSHLLVNIHEHVDANFSLSTLDFDKVTLRNRLYDAHKTACKALNLKDNISILDRYKITVDDYFYVLYRTICNHIAPMTDNYATKQLISILVNENNDIQAEMLSI